MSAQNTNCVVLACDGCGTKFGLDEGIETHFVSTQEAREAANDTEWRFDGVSDWCYECQSEPHDHVPDEDGRCRKCGVVVEDDE